MLAGLPLFVSTRAGSRMEFQFAVRQVPRLRMRDYLFSVQTGRDEAKEVRSFRLAGALHARFAAVYDAYLAELREHVRRRTLLGLVSSISSSTLLAGTLLVLVWLVSRGDIGIAAAGAAVVAVRLLAQQLSGLFASSQQIFESGLFLDDLDDFLRLDVERDATGGASDVAPFNRLEVDGLSFRYPGATGPALQDVSFEIARGEVVALVGENGSGKSTLAKLLAALYRPDTGFIRWDGTDIATLDPGTIRDTIAVIFQDFVRYQLPARDNIAFGRADAPVSDARVDAAADTGGAIEFLRALPEGYETILSRSFKGGQDLSQGQWQRVALARAFYRDAPFVILDEPSSSLDPRAEHRLFASLRETLHGRTVLYVSHRMSTVREADRILVLHEGRLIESGRHEELLATGGRYAELFRLQAGAYLDPTP
jgi:ATP-binding cassette subfamily B protein